MAKTRQQKEEELNALREKFSRSKGVAFTRYMGLNVADLQDLRRKLRAEENELVVAKKSLLGIMVSENGLSKDEINNLPGDIAVVFGYKNPRGFCKNTPNRGIPRWCARRQVH
jgi:large subunit ribosomal protein L10